MRVQGRANNVHITGLESRGPAALPLSLRGMHRVLLQQVGRPPAHGIQGLHSIEFRQIFQQNFTELSTFSQGWHVHNFWDWPSKLRSRLVKIGQNVLCSTCLLILR